MPKITDLINPGLHRPTGPVVRPPLEFAKATVILFDDVPDPWGAGQFTDNGSGVARQFLPDIGSNIIGDAIQAVAITPDNIWLASRLSGIYQLNRKTLDIQQ